MNGKRKGKKDAPATTTTTIQPRLTIKNTIQRGNTEFVGVEEMRDGEGGCA
jgi:hypothetical protein